MAQQGQCALALPRLRCQLDVLSPPIFDAAHRAPADPPRQMGRIMQRRPDELEAKKAALSEKAETLSPACSTRCPARHGRAEVVRHIAATAAKDVAFVEPFRDVAIRLTAKVHGKSALRRAQASAPSGVEPMTLLSIVEAGIIRLGDDSPYSRLADFTLASAEKDRTGASIARSPRRQSADAQANWFELRKGGNRVNYRAPCVDDAAGELSRFSL